MCRDLYIRINRMGVMHRVDIPKLEFVEDIERCV